jgi:hypothetical protein
MPYKIWHWLNFNLLLKNRKNLLNALIDKAYVEKARTTMPNSLFCRSREGGNPSWIKEVTPQVIDFAQFTMESIIPPSRE